MVVLATKVYVDGEARERALDSLESLVANDVGDLDVDWTIGVREDDFPSVTLTGADAVVARNLLRERWGAVTPGSGVRSGADRATAPEEEAETAADATHVGTLEAWDDDGLVLDAGQEVRVPTEQLGLGPGTATQIRTRFGLIQHLPMRFENGDPPELADAERDRLYEWTRGTGRVNVNSATRAEVRATLNRAGHARDVVTVERLGLLEQSVVCRPETDPPGLVASIGEYLPAELLCVIPQ